MTANLPPSARPSIELKAAAAEQPAESPAETGDWHVPVVVMLAWAAFFWAGVWDTFERFRQLMTVGYGSYSQIPRCQIPRFEAGVGILMLLAGVAVAALSLLRVRTLRANLICGLLVVTVVLPTLTVGGFMLYAIFSSCV